MRYTVLISFVMIANTLHAQEVRKMGLNDLKTQLDVRNDTTYVINFWATWCSPCVTEIGFFEDIHRSIIDEKLKFFLISLDFPNQLEQRVIPFIKEHDLTAAIGLMTELDYNKWIPLVDKEWSGAIPATLIYKGENRSFLPHELSYDELNKAIQEILNK